MIPSFDCFLPVTPTENLAGQLADNRFSSDTGNMGDARGRRQKDAEAAGEPSWSADTGAVVGVGFTALRQSEA